MRWFAFAGGAAAAPDEEEEEEDARHDLQRARLGRLVPSKG
jgi:hypothetical protein